MKNNKTVLLKKLVILLLIFSTLILQGCELEENSSYENGITDNSIHKLESSINSIEDGLPFALKSVKEWRDDLYLDYVNVCFKDKKQITEGKGVITYFFYGKNVKDGLDAEAQVQIDMEENSIISFSSGYGTSKVLLGGANQINEEDWNIDIKDTINIAKDVIGENVILNHDEPNLVMRCSKSYWEVAIQSNQELPADDYLVILNPKSGKAITYKIGAQEFKIEEK